MIAGAARGFGGIALAAKIGRDAVAHLDIVPAIGKPQARISGKPFGRLVLERIEAKTAQVEMADDESDAAPDIGA